MPSGVCLVGGSKVDIVLWVLAGLVMTLVWCTWSIGRSYFERGRIRGIKEAVRELRSGMFAQLDNQKLPADVKEAISAFESLLEHPAKKGYFGTDPIHAQLWSLGAALGEACWLKGHGAGVRRKAPAEGKIRIDLSRTELFQLAGLANFGFQHMMPNLRIIDMLRFASREDATEASRALSKLEGAISREHRPDLLCHAEGRENLIDDWWKPMPERAIA